MITTSTGQTPAIAAMMNALTPAAGATRAPTLTMVSASRMAGEIAVWAAPDKAPAAIAAAQADAAQTADENRAVTATPVTTTATMHAFSFHDLLDMLNPLQHIPVVNQIYRRLTGEAINPAMQVAGDTVYGGPLGGAISLANMLVMQATGHDLPGTMLAMARGENIVPQTAGAGSAAQVAAIMPAAGGLTTAPRQGAFHSLHLNA